jgi:general secretion pathway protein G
MTLITHRRSRALRRSAFTLLEVLVVVAIIVALAGVASIYVFRYLDDSNKDAARATCRTLAQAIESYVVKNDGEMPGGWEDVRPYLKETGGNIFATSWGEPYTFSMEMINGKQTVVVSTKAKDGEVLSNLKLK